MTAAQQYAQRGSRMRTAILTAAIISAPLRGGEMTWDGLRDGIVHIRASEKTRVRIQWQGVWAARGNPETLYLINPRGDLVRRIDIGAESQDGVQSLALPPQSGDYRLHIPGPSFRRYTVSVASAQAIFEPVKHHVCMHARARSVFFFHAPAGTTFSVGAKYHNGADSIIVTGPGNEHRTLALTRFGEADYLRHDVLRVPASAGGGLWRLTIPGNGKIGFWLDGIDNYFAQDSSALFRPEALPQSLTLAVGKNVLGTSPLIGSLVPGRVLTPEQLAVLRALGLRSATLYAFRSRCITAAGEVSPQCGWYSQYSNAAGIRTMVTMFSAGEQRVDRGDMDAMQARQFAAFASAFIRRQQSIAPMRRHYVGIFDEPNLRFADKKSFDTFLDAVSPVFDSLRMADSTVMLLMPESAGLVSGPLHAQAHERRGADWLTALCGRRYNSFDAVGWHEWSVRHLIELEWFSRTIEAAWNIVEKHRPKNSAPKPLCITQTNIAPGAKTSPYEQETFYAALWLAGAAAQAAATGKCALMNWLPASDEGPVRKGLVARDGAALRIRPVGHAMPFINAALLDSVLPVSLASVECDAAATLSASRSTVSVLFVNKYARPRTVHISIEPPGWPPAGTSAVEAWMFDSLCRPARAALAVENACGPLIRATLSCDAPAIYRITFVRNHSGASPAGKDPVR